jgi:hypothetical protein
MQKILGRSRDQVIHSGKRLFHRNLNATQLSHFKQTRGVHKWRNLSQIHNLTVILMHRTQPRRWTAPS